MSHWKLFEGKRAYVSTFAFHEHRERAPHLEQPAHRDRLLRAAELVYDAQALLGGSASVSDLGCGDGGLLSLVQDHVGEAWGYDFTPANAAGWAARGVTAHALDVFGADAPLVRFGDIAVVTEVLEHLSDPHGALRWIGEHSPLLVASSPWNEDAVTHDECHAWAFDRDGYRELVRRAGYELVHHGDVGRFQVVLAARPAWRTDA
jgi:SAM-dependent methyltransferase